MEPISQFLSQRYQGARRPGDVGFAPTEAERRSNLEAFGCRAPRHIAPFASKGAAFLGDRANDGVRVHH